MRTGIDCGELEGPPEPGLGVLLQWHLQCSLGHTGIYCGRLEDLQNLVLQILFFNGSLSSGDTGTDWEGLGVLQDTAWGTLTPVMSTGGHWDRLGRIGDTSLGLWVPVAGYGSPLAACGCHGWVTRVTNGDSPPSAEG